MKKTVSLYTFMLALMMGIAGCASSDKGTVIMLQDPEQLEQIQVNKSTRKEVRKLLGEPQSITTHSNMTEHWVYQSKHTDYTESYVAKKALSFVPVPYLGTAVGLVDVGPEKIVDTHTLSLLFSQKGILQEKKRETKHK